MGNLAYLSQKYSQAQSWMPGLRIPMALN